MTETAEIRWFAPGPVPDAVGAWFDTLAPSAEIVSEARTDRYLVPATAAVGEKWREGSAERKTRTAVGAPLGLARADGAVEHWRKAQVDDLPDAPAVDVSKRRRTVRTEVPGGVCTLEVGTTQIAGATWWTVCLEANGPTADGRQAALRETARRWLGRPDAPTLPIAAARGYPAWIIERCC